MQNYANQHGMSTKPRRLLITAMNGQRLLLDSRLLQWYMKKGIHVSYIFEVIEFAPIACFEKFVNRFIDVRRAGDCDPSLKPIANNAKTCLNSGYGSWLLVKSKHQTVSYTTDVSKICRKINEPGFKSLQYISEDLVEISMAKSKIVCDMPMQVGWCVQQLSELRLLEFYYDFLDYYCDRSDWQLQECDTDSLYISVSGNHEICSIVRPHLLAEFDSSIHGHCNDEPYTPAQGYFLPRECCERHNMHNQKTPALFKIECKGREQKWPVWYPSHIP